MAHAPGASPDATAEPAAGAPNSNPAPASAGEPVATAAGAPAADPGDAADPPPTASLDRLLHEPARLTIATLLYAVESADFLFLLRESGLSKGNLSSHLAKLEGAGYVAIDKSFRGKIPLTLLRLTRSGRSAFAAYKRGLNALLGDAGGKA